MPELPEVETIRAQLAPRLEGRTLARVEILDPRLTRPYDLFEVAEELEGDRVVSVERRGKYLLLRLESGLDLLVHLRMTGGFHWTPVTPRARRARARRRHAARLPRRAPVRHVARPRGRRARAVPRDEERPGAARPAVHAALAGAQLARRKAPLKAVLLDQRVVAGLGNIYADEALWRARLNPLRPANELSPRGGRAGSRGRSAPSLRTGIERQGSTLRDYAAPDGASGSMQEEFRVYGRDG